MSIWYSSSLFGCPTGCQSTHSFCNSRTSSGVGRYPCPPRAGIGHRTSVSTHVDGIPIMTYGDERHVKYTLLHAAVHFKRIMTALKLKLSPKAQIVTSCAKLTKEMTIGVTQADQNKLTETPISNFSMSTGSQTL